MTRKEQIRQAANESLPNKNKDNGFYEAFELVLIQYFIKGAMWADEHPDISMVSALAYEAGRNDAIEQACTWLKTNYEDIGIRWMRGDKAEDFVQQFKKAMEE